VNRLFAISYSPWSEKARWALDVRRAPYREELFVPMLTEPWLRIKLRRFTGKITAPVLFTDDGRALTDSFDIARFADTLGDGPRLFPAGQEEEMRRWNDRSEEILRAARALSVAKAIDDPDARREAVPSVVPRALRPAMGRVGVVYLQKKYALSLDREASAAVVAEGLRTLREALAGKPTLGPELTYADIVMAVSLQLVAPVAHEYIKLGRATRRVCTHAPIVEEFADLLKWRDELYATWRRR
jgi:glutathione S-transferase